MRAEEIKRQNTDETQTPQDRDINFLSHFWDVATMYSDPALS